MSNILVISEREEIIKVISSVCDGKAQTIHSSEEAVSYIANNNINIVILDLEVSDLNIFVAHELLKVCKSENNAKVIIVTSEKTESEIESYKKLIHTPDEFIIDSDLIINLDKLLKKHSFSSPKINKEIIEKPIVPKPFTEDIHEEIEELDIFDNELLEENETNQGIFTVSDSKDHSGEIDLTVEDSSEIKTNEIITEETLNEIPKEPKPDSDLINTELNKKDTIISELKAEIISLEKQNEFMKSENKQLLVDNNKFKETSEAHKKKYEDISLELTNINNELNTIKITTKETVEEKDKEIKNMQNNYNEEIENFNSIIEQSKSDKKILETSLMDEIGLLKTDNEILQKNNEEKTKESDILKNELENIKNDLETKNIEIENLKIEIGNIEKAKDEKEKILISSIDHLKKNISSEEDKNNNYEQKFNIIAEISKNLSEAVKN